MNYNKSSTKKRVSRVDSKGTKIRNKIALTALKLFMVLVVAISIIGVAAGIGVAKGIIDSAPDITQMDVVPTGFSTSVYADDGVTEIGTLVGAGANREYVTIDQIPLHMQQAFVAIEDERFYQHNGIDLQSIARAGVATLRSLLAGDVGMQGGSTITQQLIKNNVLTSWTGETTFIEKLQRKIQEQYLALKLEEQVQDKDWILENYLNTINLGSNTLGVQAASQKYFGKDVSELTLSESAVIAGITQNPYGYNPIRFPEKNKARRERVLNAMLEQEYISKTQYDEAMADDVYARIASFNTNTTESYNSYFIDALIDDLLNDLVAIGYTETDAYKLIYQGGLTIISTQNMDMQVICDEEVNNLENYPMNPKYSFFLSFSVKKANGTTKSYTQNTMLSYYKEVNNNENFTINYNTEDECYAAIEAYQQAVLEEGDTLVENSTSITITLQPQVALTIIDQSTGEVKAMTGGRGDKVGNRTWNRATDTIRQPGSTFKIIGCFAAALDAGGKTLASVQDDAPYTVDDKSYRNSGGGYHGLTTIREAITHSYNIPTVKTLNDIGLNLSYEYVLKFGISTLVEGDKHLSGLALGGLTHGVKNIELTAAYAAIANGGDYIEPSYYSAVYDHDGNLLLDNTKQETHEVITEQTAWLLTDAMRDVLTSGTGGRAYFSGMDIAGKSGTTTDSRDSLFAGYSPYYTCVVWGGFDDNTKQNDSLTSYTRNIWRETMARIHANLDYKEFERPTGITTAAVCMDSGLLPVEETCDLSIKGNAVYEEFFANGTVPVDNCATHMSIDVCKLTGMVANANCQEIEKKVYIVGASPETPDKEFIATEEFLATVCTCTEVVTPPTADPNTGGNTTPGTTPGTGGTTDSGTNPGTTGQSLDDTSGQSLDDTSDEKVPSTP